MGKGMEEKGPEHHSGQDLVHGNMGSGVETGGGE